MSPEGSANVLCAGSWVPLFGLAATIHVGTSLFFGRYASLKTGREILSEREALKAAAAAADVDGE